MKNTKTKKQMILLFLLGATTLVQPSVRADIAIGDVLGTAWTIGNIIVGETTLTPAYAVDSYFWYFKENVGSTTKKMRRDLLGNYFYYTKFESPTLPTNENSFIFPIYSLNKLNLTCRYDLGGGNIVTITTIEKHTEWVWLSKVESTGLWPDNGPWTVWLKAGGNHTSCNPSTPVPLFFWVPATVSKTQGQSVSVGNPDCNLTYPFYLASDFYR